MFRELVRFTPLPLMPAYENRGVSFMNEFSIFTAHGYTRLLSCESVTYLGLSSHTLLPSPSPPPIGSLCSPNSLVFALILLAHV